jgi:hypothetical protein
VLLVKPPAPVKKKSERELRLAAEKEEKKNRLTRGQKSLTGWITKTPDEETARLKRQKVGL